MTLTGSLVCKYCGNRMRVDHEPKRMLEFVVMCQNRQYHQGHVRWTEITMDTLRGGQV